MAKYGWAIAGLVAALLGAAAAWAVLDRSEAVSASLFVLGLIVLIPLGFPGFRAWPGTSYVLAGALSLCLLGLGTWSLKPAKPDPRPAAGGSAPPTGPVVSPSSPPPVGSLFVDRKPKTDDDPSGCT